MQRRRVIVGLTVAHGWLRDAARGIGAYIERRPHWECHFTLLERTIVDGVGRAASADGMIIDTRNAWRAAKLKVPVVVVGESSGIVAPCVKPGAMETGRMAAEHLMERGFRRFAFFAFDRGWPLMDAGEAFEKVIAAKAYAIERFWIKMETRPKAWFSDHAQLLRWVRRLEKPVAIFCKGDPAARLLAMACQTAGVSVPGEVAILGHGNDELRCRLCKPELSSIETGADRMGYEAAKLLDAMMEGRTVPKVVNVAPLRVVVRDSTDIVTTENEHVRAAARYINEHLAEGVSVKLLMRQSKVSRRTLELAFRQLLGRTIHGEIVRAQVQRASRLLEEEDATVAQIARACGVGCPVQFGKMFKARTGATPTQYRKMHQRKSFD